MLWKGYALNYELCIGSELMNSVQHTEEEIKGINRSTENKGSEAKHLNNKQCWD